MGFEVKNVSGEVFYFSREVQKVSREVFYFSREVRKVSREVFYFSREVRKVSGEVEDVSRQNLWVADCDEAPTDELFLLMLEQKKLVLE